MTLVDTILMIPNHLQLPYRLLSTKLWALIVAVFLPEPALGWACHGCCEAEAHSANCLTSGLRLSSVRVFCISSVQEWLQQLIREVQRH